MRDTFGFSEAASRYQSAERLTREKENIWISFFPFYAELPFAKKESKWESKKEKRNERGNRKNNFPESARLQNDILRVPQMYS